MANKQCAQCGADFTCGISAGKSTCWCFDLPNVIPLDSIPRDDDAQAGCLCPACLQAKIDTRLAEQPEQDTQ